MKIKANIVVDDNGAIILPDEFLKSFKIRPGDKLLILGDIDTGIAVKKYDIALHKALNLIAAMGFAEKKEEE